jgi:hypothetical protein
VLLDALQMIHDFRQCVARELLEVRIGAVLGVIFHRCCHSFAATHLLPLICCHSFAATHSQNILSVRKFSVLGEVAEIATFLLFFGASFRRG